MLEIPSHLRLCYVVLLPLFILYFGTINVKGQTKLNAPAITKLGSKIEPNLPIAINTIVNTIKLKY